MNDSSARKPKILTAQVCNEMYNLNIGTLANLRHQKRGPRYYKVGRRVYYRAADVESWLEKNVVLTIDSIGND